MTTRPTEVARIREEAISEHQRMVGYFNQVYEEMAEDYFSSTFAYGRKKLEVLLRQVLSSLPQGSRVADIGCGTGPHLTLCHQMGYDVTGVEPSSEMRAKAQEANPGVPVLDGRIHDIPLQGESFDLVLAVEVLRYLHPLDIQRSYQEMLRILKPGGRLFFTMVNRYALDGFYAYDRFRRLFGRLVGRQMPVHCEFVTPNRVRKDLFALGVKDVDCYGRMFALLRNVYKVSPWLGTRVARLTEPLDDWLSPQSWMRPFAGHLICIATKPELALNNPRRN